MTREEFIKKHIHVDADSNAFVIYGATTCVMSEEDALAFVDKVLKILSKEMKWLEKNII